MAEWIELALAHAVMAGRNYQAARDIPAARPGLHKMAERHLREAVRFSQRKAALHSAIAATYLDDGVAQPAAGDEPAGPCERRGTHTVARKGGT